MKHDDKELKPSSEGLLVDYNYVQTKMNVQVLGEFLASRVR